MQSLSTVSVILTLFAQSGQSSADWLPHRVHHGEPTRGDYPAKEDDDTVLQAVGEDRLFV